MKNIAHLLDVIDGVRDNVALGLMSDPGLSKTAQVKQWAEAHDRTYCELIISQRMPSEISGMPMPVNDTHKMEIYDFDTLLNLKDGDVLAFDEFTNGNIQTLNACLTLIQERTMLSGKKLPSLVVVAMGNPQGKCDLLPQTKQRFWWVDVTWDSKTWIGYMRKAWGIRVNSKLVNTITEQYKVGFGNAAQFNYYTPRTVENLLRVAKTIELEDPFWELGEIARPVVEALYDSLANRDKFRDIQEQLMDWVSAQTDSPWSLMLMTELGRCESMSDLRALVRMHEIAGDAEEFVAFMKETGKAGESDE